MGMALGLWHISYFPGHCDHVHLDERPRGQARGRGTQEIQQKMCFMVKVHCVQLLYILVCLLVGFLTCLAFATAPRGCCTVHKQRRAILKKDLERIWWASVSWKVILVSVSCCSWRRWCKFSPSCQSCYGFGVPKGLLYILLSKKDYLLVLASIVTGISGISGRVVHITCSFPGPHL